MIQEEFNYKWTEPLMISAKLHNLNSNHYVLTVQRRVGKFEDSPYELEYKDNVFGEIKQPMIQWSLDMEKTIFQLQIKDIRTGEKLNCYMIQLGELLIKRDMLHEWPVGKTGNTKVTIQCTLEPNPNPMAVIKLKGNNLPKKGGVGFFGECDPFFRIRRPNPKNQAEKQTVYESGVFRNEKNPKFKKINVRLERLCGGIFIKKIINQGM